ncbi:hypothetical protein BT96DRAFT_1105039 [Gymnopus androsaceus JB14]|uniref:Uncharacterized protein n=1 Tax=Gymnopus androsaceus JB14 TaxID=1447944 RepID=A0A6A4HJC0_9AGAR|nr:hypothetical protein BT96DRAFT_1105039 [Gymnopus androsaceus JB14]
MTEYDYSPEGYQRYLDTQKRISKWVNNTNAHSNEFRSPFGARSDVPSSSSRTPPPSSSSAKSKPHGGSSSGDRSRVREDDRGRRSSISSATLRPSVSSGSNAAYHRQRSPQTTRHSSIYSPPPERASRTAVIPTQALHVRPSQTHRRSQSLSHFHSQSNHHRDVVPSLRSYPRTPNTGSGYNSPRRSATLPTSQAYTVVPQSTSTSHHTHSTHRPPPSQSHRTHHHHHHHHSHSRSQSTPRPRSSSNTQPLYSSAMSPTYAVVDDIVYAPKPGDYLIIPPRGRKVNVILPILIAEIHLLFQRVTQAYVDIDSQDSFLTRFEGDKRVTQAYVDTILTLKIRSSLDLRAINRRTAGKEPRVNERNEQMKNAGLIQRCQIDMSLSLDEERGTKKRGTKKNVQEETQREIGKYVDAMQDIGSRVVHGQC